MWKDIKDYQGIYQINELGEILTLKRFGRGSTNSMIDRYMKQRVHNGYSIVDLSKNGTKKTFSVHRLVAETFIINTENKQCINHKDGNRLNNNVTNLEWCTHSENNKHSYQSNGRTNPMTGIKGSLNKLSTKTQQLTINDELIQTFDSMTEASSATGVCISAICEVRNGNRKSAGGFKWKKT